MDDMARGALLPASNFPPLTRALRQRGLDRVMEMWANVSVSSGCRRPDSVELRALDGGRAGVFATRRIDDGEIIGCLFYNETLGG